MSPSEARTKLAHAILWLQSEPDVPAWFAPGLYFALGKLAKTRDTFYINSPHRSNKCQRCAEIQEIAKLGQGGSLMARWSIPYHGIQHLEGLPKGRGVRQVTLTVYPSGVDVYALGPEGFTPIWERKGLALVEAMRTAEEFVRSMGITLDGG